MDKDDVVSVLNDLIETCKDGENGFSTCAENTDSIELKRLFSDRAHKCAEAATELKTEVRRLGGDPDDHGSVSGALHRGWLNLKTAVTSDDDRAVLAECERGEDVAVEQYQDALSKDLPSDIRNIVEKQYRGAQQNHDLIRTLEKNADARS